MKKTVMAEKGPKPAGPDSQPVDNGSGLLGQGPVTRTGTSGRFRGPGPPDLEKRKTILEPPGRASTTCKVNAYVTDLTRFQEFTECQGVSTGPSGSHHRGSASSGSCRGDV